MSIIRLLALAVVGTLLMMWLLGCVAMDKTMYNPQTADTKRCTSAGFGWLGVPIAIAGQAACEQNLKSAGYQER